MEALRKIRRQLGSGRAIQWIVPMLIALAVALVVMVTNFAKSADADHCLDQGGSFDYASCRCDFNASHAIPDTHSCP